MKVNTAKQRPYTNLLARGEENVRAAAEANRYYGYEPMFSPELTTKNYFWTDGRGPKDPYPYREWPRETVNCNIYELYAIKDDLAERRLVKPVSAIGIIPRSRAASHLYRLRYPVHPSPRPYLGDSPSKDHPPVRMSVPIILMVHSDEISDDAVLMDQILVIDGWARIAEAQSMFDWDIKMLPEFPNYPPEMQGRAEARGSVDPPVIYLPAVVLTRNECRAFL